MAVTYSYKITPTGRITYLKNDKRVAKAEIPAKTLARLEKEIASKKTTPSKKAPAKKPSKKAAKVTFEDDDTIPLPPMMNPSSSDVEDMLIIENYNKCAEKCNWGENACNVDTGRCIKKLKSGGVPKAYNSFKSGNKTIVSKKLSEDELKDKISIALKPKGKAAPKKKAPKKKASPKKPSKKRPAKVIIDDKIAENFEKCKETCDWSESVCNVDTGRCVKRLKNGDLSKAYKDYTRVNVDDEIVVISKKSSKKAIENSISIPTKKKSVKASKKPAPKKKAKRCDDVDDYVECAEGKICNATTGRCVADNSKNRAGMMQIEVDGRIIVGKANVIAKLSKLFSGAKIGPALTTAKPKGRPKKKPAVESRSTVEIPIRSTSRSASRREFEEQLDRLYSLALRMPIIDIVDVDAVKVSDGMKLLEEAKDSGDKAKINSALKEGKSILSQINRLEKRKDAFLEKVGDRIEANKKKLKGVDDVDAVVVKVAETDITNMVMDFNQTLNAEISLLRRAIHKFLKDVRTFAEMPEEIQIPARKLPTPPPRRSVAPTPPPRGPSSKGPMDVMIPGTSPSSRLSAVMGAERPDFEKIVSTAIDDATASARKTPPPLPVTTTRRRSAEPDIIDKTKLNIERAFERCLVELDK